MSNETMRIFFPLEIVSYCRVSTLQEQQETSYEAQVNYYTEKIKSNLNWKLAGIYADDGKSATSTSSMVPGCANILLP